MKKFAYSAVAAALALSMNVAYAEETTTLEEINVEGGSMYRMGEVPFTQAKSTVAINAESLQQQGVTKADQLGRYQAGFSNQVFGSDTNTNWFRIRGASVQQATDGLPMTEYGFFTPHTHTFGLEAVEITKGADSLTFGAANGGGLVNYVSKRPHLEQVGKGEFSTLFGNHNQYGINADYTGAFNADNSARYRLVGSFYHTDGEWNGTENKTFYLAPSLEFDLSDKTRFTLLASYQRDSGVPSSNFLPQDGTLVPTAHGYIGRDVNLGDPVNDRETNRQHSIGYEFAHDFGNGLSLNSSYRYSYVRNFHRGTYAYPGAYDWSTPNQFPLFRGTVFNNGTVRTHALNNYLSYEFSNDMFKNTLVAGVDYNHSKIDTHYTLFGAATQTDAFNPSVGYRQQNVVNSAPAEQITSRQLGLYLQDSLTVADTVKFGFGARHDRVNNNLQNSAESSKISHNSYSGSVMYLGPQGLNPYYSYSESFHIPRGLSGTNSLYKPAISKQHEVGVKYLPTWLDGMISVAYFQAKDKGALVMLPTGSTVSNDNDVKRKGVELQAEAKITKNINALLSYTYLKSVTERTTGEERNPLLPKHSFSIAADYSFDQGMLEGLTLGAGVRYVGKSVTSTGSIHSGANVPSATVVDVMARYAFNKNWTAQVNVQNLGDRRFVAGCDYYCYYGASRNLAASLTYKF